MAAGYCVYLQINELVRRAGGWTGVWRLHIDAPAINVSWLLPGRACGLTLFPSLHSISVGFRILHDSSVSSSGGLGCPLWCRGRLPGPTSSAMAGGAKWRAGHHGVGVSVGQAGVVTGFNHNATGNRCHLRRVASFADSAS